MILPLSLPDLEEAACLYTDVFIADEPTTRYHAPDPAEFLPSARHYMKFLLEKEFSFIFRDESGRIIGFIFSIDLTDDPGEDPVLNEFISHFLQTVRMIDELEETFLPRRERDPGLVLHVFQIGVHRNFRGQGIAQSLITRVISHAEERGYEQIIADCTGPVSRRAFERCRFREVGSLRYNTFNMDGESFFSGLPGGISLMIRDLGE